MDKIVHEFHERQQPIHVPQIIEKPYIVEVSRPQHLIHYKEVPVEVQTNRNVPVRTIIDELKEVTKEVHHHNEVQIIKDRVKEIVKQSTEYIQKEIEK